MVNEKMMDKMRNGDGFIAALDQSGGSTPKALRLYGVDEHGYHSKDEMFDVIHEMRTRIMTSPSFDGDRVLGAILFEKTMDRDVMGMPTAKYLWDKKSVVPFLKVDKGLDEVVNGAQLMKPIPDLDALLARAKDKGVFGTKMRSVIRHANMDGIKANVDQQFEVGRKILDAGLIPILEPEVDIEAPDKEQAEEMLRACCLKNLATLNSGQQIMFKLTLPEHDNFYTELIDHPSVLRVVALSGGYSRQNANEKLSRNNDIVASFSRALTEGLTKQQSDEEFNKLLGESIGSIFDASMAPKLLLQKE